jgi:5-methylthioribose kinase
VGGECADGGGFGVTISPHLDDEAWLLSWLPDASQDEIERFQEKVAKLWLEGTREDFARVMARTEIKEARSLTLEDIRRDLVGVAA